MLRKTTLVMALAVLVSLSAFNVPVSQGQGGNSFEGTWYLTVNFGPGAPIFTYGVVAQGSPGHDGQGIPPNPNQGNGLVIGPCDFGPLGRANGLTWRHMPLTGVMPTGVSLTYEVPSGRTPSTTLLRGNFVSLDRIEGRGVVIGDLTDSSRPDFDSKVGYDVNPVTFVLERAQMPCVDPTP